jgi:hypothetical protein
MVEVFKTDIDDKEYAEILIDQIHRVFADYEANFDLDDCDNILRVECKSGSVHSDILISFLKSNGCNAEILPDVINILAG